MYLVFKRVALPMYVVALCHIQVYSIYIMYIHVCQFVPEYLVGLTHVTQRSLAALRLQCLLAAFIQSCHVCIAMYVRY